MARSAEHWSNPSPAMVTSPYEWKILEWDDKLQTNKQTNKQYKKIINNREFVPHTLYTLYYFILIFI